MRRLRNDLPYTFRPPKMKRWMRPLVLAVNWMMQLKRQYRIQEIEEGGQGCRPGARWAFGSLGPACDYGVVRTSWDASVFHGSPRDFRSE